MTKTVSNMGFDLQLFNDGAPVAAPAAPQQVNPQAPIVTPTPAPAAPPAAPQEPQLPAGLEGATIVPEGTEGAIELRTADGKSIYIAAGQPQQAPQVPTNTPEGNEPPAEPQTVQEQFQQQNSNQQAIAEDLNSKGLNFDEIATEFDNTGELSEATRASLEKAGYPKQMVDAYIAGMQASADAFVGQVHKIAGGEDNWNQIAAFIQSQGDGMVKSFNALIGGGDLGQIQMAISGIQSQMVAAYGSSNPTIMGNNGAPTAQATGYSNVTEMTNAMRDPRYNVDAAYTNEVYAKVAASNIF